MQKARHLFIASSNAPVGFSLIELLVVIAVLAILASVAIPSFAGIARQYRVNAVTEEFIASFQLARVDAVRLGQDIVFRRLAACDVALPATTDWHCGWHVFADGNGNHVQDAAEPDLQSIAVSPGVHFKKQGSGSPQYLTINRYGQLDTLGQRFAVFPTGMDEMVGQLICFSTGTRLRTVKSAKACGDQPAS